MSKGQKKIIKRQQKHIGISADTNRRTKRMETSLLHSSPLARYKEALLDSFGVYDELGQPITSGSDQDAKPVMIGDIFVEPHCSPSRISPAEFDEKPDGEALLPVLDKLLGAAALRRVVLIGDPGMGKSTLVKWLIVSSLQNRKDQPASFP